MRPLASTLFVLGSLVVCGCTDAAREAHGCSPREHGSLAAAGASHTPELTLTAATLPASSQLPRLPLGTRLAMEAGSRPDLSVRPQQLFAALERRGILLSRKRQVLASTVGARYCELAVSDLGLGVTVCEYADDADARAGNESSHQRFDSIVPGRTLIDHGSSLLTLTHPEGARAEHESRAVVDTFVRLTPVRRAP
jgi:hypothetical protein